MALTGAAALAFLIIAPQGAIAAVNTRVPGVRRIGSVAGFQYSRQSLPLLTPGLHLTPTLNVSLPIPTAPVQLFDNQHQERKVMRPVAVNAAVSQAELPKKRGLVEYGRKIGRFAKKIKKLSRNSNGNWKLFWDGLNNKERYQVSPLYGHPATTVGGDVIAPNAVPGYTAIFNGDVEIQPDGSWLGVFRMARDGYFRSKTNKRELRPYLSDLGWFTSTDEGENWEFKGLAAVAGANEGAFAAKLELKAQGHRDDKVRYPNPGALKWHDSQIIPIERTLQGLYNKAPNVPIDRGNVLEDGRFMSVRNSKGKLEKFLFTTQIAAGHLDPRIGGPTPPLYRMAALERIDDGLSMPQVFGPSENKDTWVLNVALSRAQKRQMKNTSRLLGIKLNPKAPHPVAVALRLRGEVQLVPLDSLERMFSLSHEDWQKIGSCSGCYSTILSPSKGYRSVGSNDQPKPVANRPGLFWHFYHQTGDTEDLPYSTWVEILDASGHPKYRLPYAIEEPNAYYYRFGDIPNVVFNSGNVYSNGTITHVNGAADKTVALSRSNEGELLAEVMRFPVR